MEKLDPCHSVSLQIRAANLSGECFFWKETFARLKFGWRAHHQVRSETHALRMGSADCHMSFGVSLQACVRERASKSLLCVQDMTESDARQAVDSVFDTCFRDTEPFEHVPP